MDSFDWNASSTGRAFECNNPGSLRCQAAAGLDKAVETGPPKQLIQNMILDELSLQIIEGKIAKDDSVVIQYTDGKIVIAEAGRPHWPEVEKAAWP